VTSVSETDLSGHREIPPGAAETFMHDALVYDSDEGLLATLAPFLREGVEAGDAVSVVLPPDKWEIVRPALGPAASSVHFGDSRSFYGNPARTIAQAEQVRESMLEGRSGRLRQVGEIPFDGTEREQRDWLRYEAVINHALAHAPQWSICSYDARVVPDWVVDGMARTHPHVHHDGRRTRSHRFEDPTRVARDFCPPPPVQTGSATFEAIVGFGGISGARRLLTQTLTARGTDQDRAMELAVGLNEVVTNAIEHGGETAHVRCWHRSSQLYCEIVDDGPGVDDPLIGFRPPPPEQPGGRGLWLARQTFDDVHLEQDPDGGFRVVLAAEL
jgi:anti-sigma regulatory factor (Ser/Thr protein kinase)